MTKNNERIELSNKYCKPLKAECIKKELENQLEEYTFKSIERKNSEWIACYEDANEDHIDLSISSNSLGILKFTSTGIEKIIIDENLLLTDRIIDKRQNGIVYSIIQKQFASSNRYNKIVLTDLVEQRFTFTKDRINNLCKDVDFDNIRLTYLLLKLEMLETKVDLKNQNDFYSEFSTHMNVYVNFDGGRKVKDNIYSTRTYLNGEEVSSIFDIDGPDKLYRIYDLYNGIINPRDEYDINSINLGILSQEVFNFRALKGIDKQEDSLVGTSLANVSSDYVDYLRKFFDQQFGYTGNIGLDRDSMLLGITYKMSGPERAKRAVEKRLGIPYSEFERLDFDEQQKLIEQKTGKKIKYDSRLYIDGIPMDEDHIITREQIDKKLDELTTSGSKKFLKQLFRPFNIK